MVAAPDQQQQPVVTDPTVRARQQLVNFGVISLGRVLGDSPHRLLLLRCECGQPDCRLRVTASALEYGDEPCEIVLVACGHEAAVRGRLVTVNQRFAKVKTTAT